MVWSTEPVDVDQVPESDRFDPHEAYLQGWWFRDPPDPTTAGLARYDAPDDLAFDTWIDGAPEDPVWVCNLVIDPVRHDVLYLRNVDSHTSSTHNTEVRRFRRDAEPGYAGLDNDPIVDLPACPDMAGYSLEDGYAAGIVTRFWLVPETGEEIYECQHPEAYPCDADTTFEHRYFTASGRELVAPAPGTLLAHVGMHGATLWMTRDGEAFVVDAEGYVAQPVDWVAPDGPSLRATAEGFRVANRRISSGATVVQALHLHLDGSVDHLELPALEGRRNVFFDCVFRSDDELLCIDTGDEGHSVLDDPADWHLAYHRFDLSTQEVESTSLPLPSDRRLYFSDVFSGP